MTIYSHATRCGHPCHRDLKPASIKISPEGVVKIRPVGAQRRQFTPLARTIPKSELTNTDRHRPNLRSKYGPAKHAPAVQSSGFPGRVEAEALVVLNWRLSASDPQVQHALSNSNELQSQLIHGNEF